ncbi:MAG: domain fusion protein YloV [Acidimicrobiales bacterium]|nr:domain fusion protein YloV [Acidimicrobiales bacterium]
MTVLERLDADDLRRVIIGFRDALRAHREGINRLNVYPVPDGDTGSNMTGTVEFVVETLDGADRELAATCKAIGQGALMGARGNSGLILCKILRGFTESVAASGSSELDAAIVSAALEVAAKGAYEAVGDPKEGTILTVVREAADGAVAAAAAGGSLVEVLDRARVEGHASLARTPELLPELAAAGVVDAGGAGLLLLIDAFLTVVDGRPLPEASVTEAEADKILVEVGAAGGTEHDHGHAGGGIADLRYEVMYILEAPDAAIPGFKDVWTGLGDSIVVVGGEGLWNCHIHTDDIGPAVEAAIEIGKPSRIRVTDLLDEVEEERWVREAGEHPEVEAPQHRVTTAVVAVATGDGIRRIFHSLGVQQVLTGGQSMNPSTSQLLEAVEAAPADEVVILPNNKNIIAVAEEVDATTTKTVRVVPTRGIPEGFAALLAYDPDAPSDENAAEMAESAANVVAGEVTRAVRASTCEVGPIAEGDYLGIARHGIRAVAPSVADAAIGLLAELLAEEHEIVTLIEGEGATAGDTRRITEWLSEQHPDVSAEIHHGGQPLYPYFLGLE